MEIQQGKFCGGPWVPVHVDHNPALAPSGVLRISRDRDDWRIFGGLKFLILGWGGGGVENFGKYLQSEDGSANKFLWLRN